MREKVPGYPDHPAFLIALTEDTAAAKVGDRDRLGS